MSVAKTKAQELGVKPAILSRSAKRETAKIRRQLEALAYRWSEIDGGVEFAIQELYDKLDAIDITVDDAVEALRHPFGWEGEQ